MTAYHRALDAADISLIERVKATPTLYDCSVPDFKFAFRKEESWRNVAILLGESVTDVKRRWTCLRDRYTRELKQMQLHPERTDYGNSDFFRQMDFLRKFVRKRRERRRGSASIRHLYTVIRNCEESNCEIQKIRNISEETLSQSEETINENTQDEFENKLEVSTTEAAETYPEFVEVGGQITDVCEEYEEQPHQRIQSPVSTPSKKFTISNVAQTPRQSATISNGLAPLASVIPITFLNHTPPGVAVGITNKKYNLSSFKTSHLSSPPPPQQQQQHTSDSPKSAAGDSETEDDFFCKTIRSYLHQLSRRHKIKAKVEMFQILEKYIDIEEDPNVYQEGGKG